MLRSQVSGTGHKAVRLSGGDRTTLTPGAHRVENCEVHHYARSILGASPGITLWGCGNVARHNLIHDAPNAGIFFNGNDQLIELNEIRNVCQGTSDAGAIYDGGDWGNWGAVIRNNFIHDVYSIFDAWDVHGVYLDETDSGVLVEGNVLYRMGGEGMKFNAGHDNRARYNVIVDCNSAIYGSQMGIGEIKLPIELYKAYLQESDPSLKAAAYSKARDAFFASYIGTRAATLHQNGCKTWLPIYQAKGQNYTSMPDPGVAGTVGSDWEVYVAGDGPKLYSTPVGSAFTGNIYWRNPAGIRSMLYSGYGYAMDYYADVSNNLERDPLFINEGALDLRLSSGSPAFGIPGFKAIPMDRIGIEK